MRLLIPTFLFPPFCSPGAMRLARFLREYADRGADITVVAGAVEDYEHGFPRPQNLDFELVQGLPDSVRIIRTEAVRPGVRGGVGHRRASRVDQVEPWNALALEACHEVLRNEEFDCLFTTSNPLSGHLLGLELVEEFGLPWVAEFRDPWTTHPLKTWSSRREHARERALQKRVHTVADAVVVNTHVARADVLRAFPNLEPEKVDVVTNSFDPSDFELSTLRGPSTTLTLAYLGTMGRVVPAERSAHRPYWKRTLRAFTGRGSGFRLAGVNRLAHGPWYTLLAMSQLVRRDESWRGRLRLVLAGRLGHADDERKLADAVDELGLSGMVDYRGQVPYREALAIMDEADALLLSQTFAVDGRRWPTVPAKTYEYLAAQKPVLGLVPEGDTRRYLVESELGTLATPDDPNEIAEALVSLFGEHSMVGLNRRSSPEFLRQFRSDVLADRSWEILRKAVASRGTSSLSRAVSAGAC